jgi:hypothetical protein
MGSLSDPRGSLLGSMVENAVENVRIELAVFEAAADENGQWKLDRQPGD